MEIVNQIKYLNNVYDLLALCCEIIMFCKDYDYNSGGSVKYTAELQDVFSQYDTECRKGYKTRAFAHLKKGIEEFLNRDTNTDRIFAIALIIDDRIRPEVVERCSTGEDFIEYEGLNRQYTDQVLVTPKKINSFLTKCKAERTRTDMRRFGSLERAA